MNVHLTGSSPSAAADHAMAALAKALRLQREQAAATVALLDQAAPAPNRPGVGRFIDVRA